MSELPFADNTAVFAELYFDARVHVTAIPTLGTIHQPTVLKAAENFFLKALSAADRKVFRQFCKSIAEPTPSLLGTELVLSLHDVPDCTAALAVYAGDTVFVRCLQNAWDIYDQALPVFSLLSDTVQQFCAECTALDKILAAHTPIPEQLTEQFPFLTGLMGEYCSETIEITRCTGSRLCDLQQITEWLMEQLQKNPLYDDVVLHFYGPGHEAVSGPEIPLHLSAWIYTFLLLTHILTLFSIDGCVNMSLIDFDDRLDFRWEILSNLSAAHRTLLSLADRIPQIRVPAELVTALLRRHSWQQDMHVARGHLTYTLTIQHYTEYEPDFKYNEPMRRAESVYPEAAAFLQTLLSLNEYPTEKSGTT